MFLFITSILIMLAGALWTLATREAIVGIIAGVIGFVMLVFSFIIIVPTGKVGNLTFFGIVKERILAEGTITTKAPWNSVITHNIRVINLEETIKARASDDTPVGADVTIPFELNPLASVAITQQIGVDWIPVIKMWVRSSTRDAIAKFTWQDVNSRKKAEVSNAIRQEAITKIASTLVSAGVSKELAANAFIFHDVQLRNVKLPEGLEKAVQSFAAAEKEKETQKQLTLAAVEEAKRREQEGKGYGNLFEGFPQDLKATDVAAVLRAMANKTEADAFAALVDKGMPGDGKVVVVVGGATPMVGTGK